MAEMVSKILKWGLTALILIAFVFFFMILGGSDVTNMVLNYAYALMFIALGAIVVFFVMTLIKFPQQAIKVGISAGVVLLLFGISYAIAGENTDAEGAIIGGSKMAGAGLNLVYILIGVCSLTIIAGAVRRMLN